ncbi:hypothetical protein ABTK63_20875, partial [Acinetobacter baumannii]
MIFKNVTIAWLAFCCVACTVGSSPQTSEQAAPSTYGDKAKDMSATHPAESPYSLYALTLGEDKIEV